MTTARHPTRAPPELIPGDILWKVQLRRENKALLDKMEAMETRKRIEDAERAEMARQLKETQDDLNATNARVVELESANRQNREFQEKWQQECASIQAEMQKYLRGLTGEELKVMAIKRFDSVPLGGAAATSRRSPAPSSAGRGTTDSTRQTTNTRNARPERDTTNNNANLLKPRSAGRHQEIMSNNPPNMNRGRVAQPTSTKHPSTSSRSKSCERGALPNAVLRASGKFSKLVQDNNSMENYYSIANAMFASVEPHNEMEFCNSFIQGIYNVKTKDTLIVELQKIHPCRVVNGVVEMLCEWEDIDVALRQTGLLKAAGGSNQQAGMKRKGGMMRELDGLLY